MLRENSPEWWELEGEKKALATFHQAAERVPAYKDFLKKHNVNPEKVVTIEDFKKFVPVMTKKDYLRQYPLKDLCWDGDLSRMNVISVSSGSTGEPFFWPRSDIQDDEGVKLHELLLRHNFEVQKKSTLCVVAFSMGVWVAGTYTYTSIRELSRLGYQLTTITPGVEKEDAVRAITKLSPFYEQTIVFGYPPFVKDIIDQVRRDKTNLQNIDLKFIFAGENFSETWRSHIVKHALTRNSYYDAISIYGTADAAILGFETPQTIYARNLAVENNDYYRTLFGSKEILPALFQYIPPSRFFENVDGELVFTTKSGVPLVRYNIRDEGRVIPYRSIQKIPHFISEGGPSNKRDDHWKLPFISLEGRADIVTTFYAVNIYPDNIKAGIEDETVRRFVTGKFVAKTISKRNLDQQFIIQVELLSGIKPSSDLERSLFKTIISHITQQNAEYRRLRDAIGRKSDPAIQLIENGHEIFKVGIKHRWIASH